MKILTTRFGVLTVRPEEIIRFPSGIVGLEDCRQWVLLGDAHEPSLAWLHSITRADLALAVVNPRRFVPNYQLRVSRRAIEPLRLNDPRDAEVLSVVSRNAAGLTLNLKAPLVVNVALALGAQVIANDDQPLQYVLSSEPAVWRRSA